MLCAALFALTLNFAPPEAAPGTVAAPEAELDAPPVQTPAAEDPAPASAPASAGPKVIGPGTLVLAPATEGDYQLHDAQGQAIGGPHALGAGAQVELELDSGRYELHGPDGVVPVEVQAGEALAWDGEQLLSRELWQTRQDLAAAEAEAAALRQAPAAPPPTVAPVDAQPSSAAKTGNWRVWASPLASALIPGVGQFINGQGGKGTGLLFGAIGSTAAAAALYSLGNDGTRPAGAEYARLIGYGVFSTAAPILWIYAVADAYRVAAGKEVTPKLDHQVRLSVTRMMTVGFRADARRPGFFDDWSVSIMGQATRRFSLGVSDLSVKPGGREGPQVWQFGARFDYRVFDRRKIWIDLGAGSLFQVAVSNLPRDLDPELAPPGTRTVFSVVPYGQLDVRFFILDRMSLDLVPRLAVPLSTRYYSADRALPRFAPELELGAGLSVYF